MKNSILIITFLLLTFTSFGQNDEIFVQINDSTSLELERTEFEIGNKKVDYYNDKIPIGINGKVLLGSDGELPKSQLTKATLKIGKKVYELQIDNMYNPWFGEKFNKDLINLKKEGNQTKLKVIFSDGAGTYGAEWLIIENSSLRTILSPDENILIENIEN